MRPENETTSTANRAAAGSVSVAFSVWPRSVSVAARPSSARVTSAGVWRNHHTLPSAVSSTTSVIVACGAADESFAAPATSAGQLISNVRTKRFAVKPAAVDEAVLQMNLLGHSFYVFRNAKTDEVNVVYRRKDGHYGLIEPEA